MTTKPTFIIEYTCLSKSGKVLQDGKMRVKNKATKFEAQASFEEFLKKKHQDFGRLIIIKCTEEFDLFKNLGDIFGGENPFNKF